MTSKCARMPRQATLQFPTRIAPELQICGGEALRPESQVCKVQGGLSAILSELLQHMKGFPEVWFARHDLPNSKPQTRNLIPASPRLYHDAQYPALLAGRFD